MGLRFLLTLIAAMLPVLISAQTAAEWIMPEGGVEDKPHWGFKNGIQIGLHPLGGPRGLVRIYAPYTGQNPFKCFNFIAFEPIPKGSVHRGLSELEYSSMDQATGKRFWSGNTSDVSACPDPSRPASGTVAMENGVETLSIYIFSEKFDNGADVYAKFTFTQGHPYEFRVETFTAEGSAELDYFIATATMGNYARLRILHLADGKRKLSTELWPDYRDIHFAPHDRTPLGEMIRDGRGGVWFIASPDETDPSNAEYEERTSRNWKYKGNVATQYWYCPDPDDSITGSVNGRYCYWANHTRIPGGISYENFELIEPFRQGAAYVFGITPDSPDELVAKTIE